MTRTQLDRAVARITGESPRTIRRLGFQLYEVPESVPEPDGLCLAVCCPFCGRTTTALTASTALAECDRCDVEFDFQPDEVLVAQAA